MINFQTCRQTESNTKQCGNSPVVVPSRQRLCKTVRRNSSLSSPVLQGANSGHYSIVVLLHLHDVILAHHLSWCSFIWGEIDFFIWRVLKSKSPVIRFLGEISYRYALATIQVRSGLSLPLGEKMLK